jgi:hypothetical protein
MRSQSISAACTGLLALAVQAHIILETPKPFKFAAYGPSNPIDPTGSDYPCKIPPGVSKLEIDGSPTVMTVGEPHTMSFTGLAVHGGGSCQISLTLGFQPNKQSQFSVVHSIEGGCPAANQKGNLNDGQSPDKYQYTIPDGFAAGNYTLAWTWVNRISGGTEFYMNCAPISVVGGKSTRKDRSIQERQVRHAAVDRRGSFPGMFMANMGDVSGGCRTTEALKEQRAIKYPFPGDSVDRPEGMANLNDQPCDGNPANSGAGASGGIVGDTNSAAPSPASSPTSTIQQSPAPEISTVVVSSVPPASSTTAAISSEVSSASSAPASTDTPE